MAAQQALALRRRKGTIRRPGLDTNATWEEEIPEQNKVTTDAVKKMMERQVRERQEGSLGADETLFPERERPRDT